MTEPKEYGVLDDEGFWMGGDDGPHTFTDPDVANVLATALWVQFAGRRRFTVLPFTRATRKHDEVEAPMTFSEALRRAAGEPADPVLRWDADLAKLSDEDLGRAYENVLADLVLAEGHQQSEHPRSAIYARHNRIIAEMARRVVKKGR